MASEKQDLKLTSSAFSPAHLLPTACFQKECNGQVYGQLSISDGSLGQAFKTFRQAKLPNQFTQSQRLTKMVKFIERLKTVKETVLEKERLIRGYLEDAQTVFKSGDPVVNFRPNSWLKEVITLAERHEELRLQHGINGTLDCFAQVLRDKTAVSQIKQAHTNLLSCIKKHTQVVENLKIYPVQLPDDKNFDLFHSFDEVEKKLFRSTWDEMLRSLSAIKIAHDCTQLRRISVEEPGSRKELIGLEKLGFLTRYSNIHINQLLWSVNDAGFALTDCSNLLELQIEILEEEVLQHERNERETWQNLVHEKQSEALEKHPFPERMNRLQVFATTLWNEFRATRSKDCENVISARLSFLADESLQSPMVMYREILSRLNWPYLRNSDEILPGVEDALLSYGISLNDGSTVPPQSSEESEQNRDGINLEDDSESILEARKGRMRNLFASITVLDVSHTRRSVLAAVDSEEDCRQILAGYPQLFGICHTSSAGSDTLGNICFELLSTNDELKVRREKFKKELREYLISLSKTRTDSELTNIIANVNSSDQGKNLILETLQAINKEAKQNIPPKSEPTKALSPKAQAAISKTDYRRKEIRSALDGRKWGNHLDKVLDTNPQLLEISDVSFESYCKELKVSVELFQANQRSDLDIASKPQAYASLAKLAETRKALEKQAKFNGLMRALDEHWPGQEPYIFNAARRGFYRSGNFIIGNVVRQDYVLDNARKGDLVRQASESTFNSNTENAISILSKHGAVIKSRGCYALVSAAIGMNSDPIRHVLGQLLNFVIREIDNNDTFAYRGYFL